MKLNFSQPARRSRGRSQRPLRTHKVEAEQALELHKQYMAALKVGDLEAMEAIQIEQNREKPSDISTTLSCIRRFQ